MKNKFLSGKIKSHIPEMLYEMAEKYPMWIAGGSITSIVTNSEVNDLDIYLKKGSNIFAFAYELQCVSQLVSVTDKSVLVQHSGQMLNVILLDTYEKPEDIFDTFDFTCVMGAYDILSDEFTFHDDFLLHNSQRQLIVNMDTKFPLMSVLRSNKYKERGYSIGKNELTRLLLKVSALNISSYEEVAEQIGGMYGIEVEELVDTNKDFDLVEVIDELGKISVDFEAKANSMHMDPSDKEDRCRDNLFKILAKNDHTFKKIEFMKFDSRFDETKGVSGKTSFLMVEDRLFSTPHYIKVDDLETYTEDIFVFAHVEREESRVDGGDLWFIRSGNWYSKTKYGCRVGETVRTAPEEDGYMSSKPLEFRTFDNLKPLPNNDDVRLGKFRIKPSAVTNWVSSYVQVVEAELIEVIDKKLKTHVKAEELRYDEMLDANGLPF
jgi:molybdopterin-binding protein